MIDQSKYKKRRDAYNLKRRERKLIVKRPSNHSELKKTELIEDAFLEYFNIIHINPVLDVNIPHNEKGPQHPLYSGRNTATWNPKLEREQVMKLVAEKRLLDSDFMIKLLNDIRP